MQVRQENKFAYLYQLKLQIDTILQQIVSLTKI